MPKVNKVNSPMDSFSQFVSDFQNFVKQDKSDSPISAFQTFIKNPSNASLMKSFSSLAQIQPPSNMTANDIISFYKIMSGQSNCRNFIKVPHALMRIDGITLMDAWVYSIIRNSIYIYNVRNFNKLTGLAGCSCAVSNDIFLDFGISRPTLYRSLDNLEKFNMIKINKGQKDKRSRVITLLIDYEVFQPKEIESMCQLVNDIDISLFNIQFQDEIDALTQNDENDDKKDNSRENKSKGKKKQSKEDKNDTDDRYSLNQKKKNKKEKLEESKSNQINQDENKIDDVDDLFDFDF